MPAAPQPWSLTPPAERPRPATRSIVVRHRLRLVERPILQVARDTLVEDYAELVQKIAKKIHRRLPAHVELADIVSTGFLGLIDAAQRYNSTLHVPFAAYARRRISGTILDSLRARDMMGRVNRARVRAGTIVFHMEQFDAHQHEDARVTEMDDAAFSQRLAVRQAVDGLPPLERALIVLHIWRGLTLLAASRELGISKQRASALKSAALERLRGMEHLR